MVKPPTVWSVSMPARWSGSGTARRLPRRHRRNDQRDGVARDLASNDREPVLGAQGDPLQGPGAKEVRALAPKAMVNQIRLSVVILGHDDRTLACWETPDTGRSRQ